MPNMNVIKDSTNTIINGWIFIKLTTNLIILLDEVDIMNRTIHPRESINDQKLIFIFISEPPNSIFYKTSSIIWILYIIIPLFS